MSTTVEHDPYARGAYRRFCLPNPTSYPCAWCGQQPKRLYAYVWEPDDRTRETCQCEADKYFCNTACRRSYYGY